MWEREEFDKKGKITLVFPRVQRREIKGVQYHFEEKEKKKKIFLVSELVLEDEKSVLEEKTASQARLKIPQGSDLFFIL